MIPRCSWCDNLAVIDGTRSEADYLKNPTELDYACHWHVNRIGIIRRVIALDEILRALQVKVVEATLDNNTGKEYELRKVQALVAEFAGFDNRAQWITALQLT